MFRLYDITAWLGRMPLANSFSTDCRSVPTAESRLRITRMTQSKGMQVRIALAFVAMSVGMFPPALAHGPVMRPSPTPSNNMPGGVPNAEMNINPPPPSTPFLSPLTPSTSPMNPTPDVQNPAAPGSSSNPDLLPPQLLRTPTQSQPQQGQPGTAQPNSAGTPPAGQVGPDGRIQPAPDVSGTIQFDVHNSGDPLDLGQQYQVSIVQALNESLVNGPRAAAIRAQLPVAKAAIAAATVSPNPVLFADRGFIAEQVQRIGPTFTVDLPWKLAFRMWAAIRQYDQNKIDLYSNLWQLRADARRAYTELVIAVETQRTLTELYELTERLLEVSRKRFQAGDVPELDVLRAQLATSQADVERNVGRQRIIRARQQLNIIMGRKPESRVEVPRLEFNATPQTTPNSPFQLRAMRHGILPDFGEPVLPLEHYTEIALENRYEVKSLVAQQRVNKANLYNAMGQIIPNPIVTMGSSKAGNPPTGPQVSAQFLTLNIEMPVTNTNQGDIARFKAAGRQLKYQMLAQKNVVLAEVSSAYNNLLAARERIRVYQEHVLRDSSEVARLSRRSYEVGQSEINATLLAQQANVAIRQNYLEAVTNYQAAYTDLEQACGRPLD